MTTWLQKEIEQHHGHLSFARFMELALYHPRHGYYQSPQFELGKGGDFTTASEISPLFAQCFQPLYQQLADHLGNIDILELGAGTGRFAGNLLRSLSQSNTLLPRYYIYEISENLRNKQRLTLAAEFPEVAEQVTWLAAMPCQFKGLIIANEVLDALPVHCFRIEHDHIQERGVTYHEGQFAWNHTAPRSTELEAHVHALHQHYDLPHGYESEINLQLPSFLQSLTDALSQGILIFSDYGYGQAEYYRKERHRGTLTCFYQHQHHDNPFLHIGQQDITAHVDFTRVIDCAADLGCHLSGYTTQAAFLLDSGILTLAEQAGQHLQPAAQFNLHQAIKQLTMPTEMGERVKVMALSKNIALKCRGFGLNDRRRDL